MSRRASLARRLYHRLVRAFPQEFQNVYGDDLRATADDCLGPVWRRYGTLGLLWLLLNVATRVLAEYADELRRDLRQAVRMLAATPVFTTVTLVSLSLGIGVAACAYSEVNGLLRDLPGAVEPEQLVALHAPVSFPAYRHFRELPDLFQGMAAYVAPVPLGVSRAESVERIWGHLVTASYFTTLGVQPHAGRLLSGEDETPGREPVAVVSHRYWERHLGADPAVVGRPLRINGHPCTVVGVGPPKFLGASSALFPADVWLPAAASAGIAPELAGHALERRDITLFQVFARLRTGVSDDAAQAALNAAAQHMAESFAEPDRDRKRPRVQLIMGGKTLPLRRQDTSFFRQFLMVLGGLLLLIACANTAIMMLARAVDRRKEIAVRLALGASRARLVRQLLTESVLLAAAAIPAAFLLSVWIMRLFSGLRLPLPVPVALDLSPDWRVLLFTFAVAGFTGVAFGLSPALQATRTDLVSAFKEAGAVQAGKPRLLSVRRLLMLAQVAASLTLLLLTGYMGLGIQSTLGVQQGFKPDHLFLLSLDPVRDGYPPARSAGLLEKVLQRVQSLPAVTAACLTDTLPAALDGNTGVRFTSDANSVNWARKHVVGRGYFETAGIQILAGRGFDRRDEADGAAAVVVSQEASRRFWQGESPVGRRIELSNGAATGGFGIWPGTIDYRADMLARASRTFEVVGVVADVSEDLVASKKHPAVYFPLQPAGLARPSLRGVTLLMRGAAGADVLSAARREIEILDAGIVPFNAGSMYEHISQFVSTLRAASWTYGVMGLFGLILAAVGLAGLTSHAVARRGREIGIRRALGAQDRDVLALVMKEGLALVAAGTLCGLMLALAGIRALAGLFFSVASVQGYDPTLLAGAPLVLGALALLACYVPARHSTRVDPVETLRLE